MEVTWQIDMVYVSLRCAYLRYMTNDEVDHNQRQVTNALDQRGLRVGELFGTDCFRTIQRLVTVVRANHAIVLFTERIL